jgi:hypothetical protein
MSRKVVGLYRDQEHRELAGYHAGTRNPLELYRKTLWYKAHPRDYEYMRGLFLQRYPDGSLVRLEENPAWLSTVSDADVIVLLYADPIGLGFSDIESGLKGHLLPWAAVRVLNGRQRDFVLNRGARWSLRMRRLVSRTMVAEAMFLIFFLCVTPLLLVRDLFGGKNDAE